MMLRPEQLHDYLQRQGLPAVIRLFGDEPLLRNDCVAIIRQFAKQQGVDERLSYIQDSQFNWQELATAGQSLGLFSQTRLVELELPEAKPGREGSDYFRDLASQAPTDLAAQQCLVLLGPKLKREQLKAKWFSSLDKLGPNVNIQSPDRTRLPSFIQQRAQQHGLQFKPAALELLADWYEGNLLALDQQFMKLALLDLPQPLDEHVVRDHTEDNSRFQIFALQESLLAGQQEQALHRLERLLDAEAEPAILAWVWQREWQVLWLLAQGLPFAEVARQTRVWESQQSAYNGWLKRVGTSQLSMIHGLLVRYELAFKRDSGEDLRTLAVHITLALLGVRVPPLRASAVD